MFKQNIKKGTKTNWWGTEEKKQTKKLWSVLSCWKEWDIQREEKNARSKYTQNTQNYKMQNLQNLVLDKWNVAKVHNCISLSCRRCFFSFHLKVNVVEDLIWFGIEDHTLGPIKAREHFPEEELTLGKNRLLEVASLVEWEWIELIVMKYSTKSFGSSLLW